jgi:hypothetical protein
LSGFLLFQEWLKIYVGKNVKKGKSKGGKYEGKGKSVKMNAKYKPNG